MKSKERTKELSAQVHRTFFRLYDQILKRSFQGKQVSLNSSLGGRRTPWFAGRNLAVKIFLRSDVFNGLSAEEQAKYGTAALKNAGEKEPEEALKDLEALGVVEFGSRRDKTPTPVLSISTPLRRDWKSRGSVVVERLVSVYYPGGCP